MTILLKTEKLCKTFRTGRLDTPVLFDIDFQIARGEFVAIMGPSGCGKSTLMHIMGLMLSASSGRVRFDGHDVTCLPPAARARLRRDRIGFVFQRLNLLPTVSAYQNLALAQRVRRRVLDGEISDILAAVDMTDKANCKPGQLSIGQQQRLAVARAVIHQPAVVFADEPTGNLDSANARRILDLLADVHQRFNITIIMVTHSLSAAQTADRIIYMNDGRISDA